MRTSGPSANPHHQPIQARLDLQPVVESELSHEEQLDWLAREQLLARLGPQGVEADWPGWSRTTISGSKVQRPAFRRRASGSDPARLCRNLIGRTWQIKT